MYEKKEKLHFAANAILALQWKFRHLRGHMREALDLVLSWIHELPLELRTPLPPALLHTMFRWSMYRGLTTSGRRRSMWCRFAVGLEVGFHALLRPCELSSLLVMCIALPTDFLAQMMDDGWLMMDDG